MKRIGLIIPASNRMVEEELARAVPAGVTAHVARLRMTGVYERPIDELRADVTLAAGTLADARCDAVAFHCTANSTSGGAGGEAALLAALRAGCPAPVTTTATAIRAALDALGARSIVLVTPYTAAATEHEAEFFREAGYTVAGVYAAALGGSDAYCAAPAGTWAAALSAARRPEADAYVLSCANIACFAIIERIERDLGKPVVTSNQSVLWAMLRAAAAPRPANLGLLMDRP
jgi:maleate isomerase